MFESAGVARTERSSVNWCQPNKVGMPRLDAYFDPNERKYYITTQSVQLAIGEERAKASKLKEASEPVGSVPKDSQWPEKRPETGSENKTGRIREMEQEILDLKITNRAKDQVIDHFRAERKEIIDQLLNASRRVGELETKLLQLDGPSAPVIASPDDEIQVASKSVKSDRMG